VFSSFADPVIAAAGLGLDRQLTDLLTVPGVHAGPVLGAETAPARRSG